MIKRAALLLTMAVASLAQTAPSWDGQHGDTAVLTIAINTQMFGMSFSPYPWVTEFFVTSLDTAVAGFRVQITYKDGKGGQHSASQTVAFNTIAPRTAMASFPVAVSQIVGAPIITRLNREWRDGEIVDLVHENNGRAVVPAMEVVYP